MKVKQIESPWLASNSYIVQNKNTTILIDAGATVEQIKKEASSIDAILLTHCHCDHIANLEQIAKEFNYPVIYLSTQGIKKLSSPELNLSVLVDNLNVALDTSNFRLVKLYGGEVLDIGSLRVEVISTPGHSSCSLCFMIGKKLFSGDTLFRRGIGEFNIKDGNKRELVQSLKKIDSLKFDAVYPGHSVASIRKEQNRNLSVWIKFLERNL